MLARHLRRLLLRGNKADVGADLSLAITFESLLRDFRITDVQLPKLFTGGDPHRGVIPIAGPSRGR